MMQKHEGMNHFPNCRPYSRH